MATVNELTSAALIECRIRESADVTRSLIEGDIVDCVATVAARIVQTYQDGGQVLFFGNGGSAADAQHLAAEMCGRFLLDRRPLPALALADNSAATTAIAN